MQSKKVKIETLIPNEKNPRYIKDDKFAKLVKSIQDFPEMLELRPIVLDEKMIVLGGNMRLKACLAAGLKEVPIIIAKDLTAEQKEQFIIKDNVGFGDWDWEMLANEWGNDQLEDWGLTVFQTETDVDLSHLEQEDLDAKLQELESGVKKAIQIEFDADTYPEAQELVKLFRDGGHNVGLLLLEKLRDEKTKL